MLEIKHEDLPAKISKSLFNDTQDSSSFTCDLIMKCGPELFQYYCHRAILASASEFLYTALSEAVPGNLPVLILPDIEPRTLKQILNYIYNGEIQLEPADKDKFIAGCELLQIKSVLEREQVENAIKMEIDDDLNAQNENRETRIASSDPVITFDLTSDSSDDEENLHNKEEEVTVLGIHERQNSATAPIFNLKLHYLLKVRELKKNMLQERGSQDPPITIRAITDSIKLKFERNDLVAAEHLCEFCKKTYRLDVQKFCSKDKYIQVQFRNSNFKRHIANEHKVKCGSEKTFSIKLGKC